MEPPKTTVFSTVFGSAEGRVYFQADESAQVLIDICKNVAQPPLLLSDLSLSRI